LKAPPWSGPSRHPTIPEIYTMRLDSPGIRRSALALLLTLPCVAQRAGAQEFVGMVVYEAHAAGPDQDNADLFNTMGPRRETVVWGSGGKIRLETVGGMWEGIVVARMADSAFFRLDWFTRTATPVRLRSLNAEDQPAETMELMGAMFAPAEMERTEQTGSYAGFPCRVYTVRRTVMLRRGATARACVAEDVHVRPSRYTFKGGEGQPEQPATLPLQFDIREGLPLMLEVNEGNTTVTYTAVSVVAIEPTDSLFSVPDGYTVKEADTDG
jgi:hypothetical protein